MMDAVIELTDLVAKAGRGQVEINSLLRQRINQLEEQVKSLGDAVSTLMKVSDVLLTEATAREKAKIDMSLN